MSHFFLFLFSFFSFFFLLSFFLSLEDIYIYIYASIQRQRTDSYRSRMVTRFRMQIDSNFSFAPSSRFAINIYPWRKSVSLLFPSSVNRDSNELNIIRYDGLLFFNERLRSPRLKTFSDFNRRKIFTINWTTTNRSITKNIFHLFFFSRRETSRLFLNFLIVRADFDTCLSLVRTKINTFYISYVFHRSFKITRFLEWLLLSKNN